MPIIRKRTWTGPTGELKAAWAVDYKDGAGKRRSKQFARKKDAEAWLTQAAWEVSKGIHTPDTQSVTVEQAAKLWLDSARTHDREPTTIATYDQHVRLHIVPQCGTKKLSQLTAPMVKELLDIWMKTLSRPLATKVFRSFKAILSDAQERALVAQNVALAVRVRRSPRSKSKIVLPTKAELRSILAAADAAGGKAQALTMLAIFTGLRASELRGLNWASVDLKRAVIHVNQRADSSGQIGPPKSRAGNRTIPLPPRMVTVLKEWKLACPASPDDLVFPGAKGKPIPYRVMVATLVSPIQVAAGITKGADGGEPKYTMHAFRHAAASLWIEQNLNAKRVQTLLGHSSIQMTFDTYGHLFEQAERDADDAHAIERALYRDAT